MIPKSNTNTMPAGGASDPLRYIMAEECGHTAQGTQNCAIRSYYNAVYSLQMIASLIRHGSRAQIAFGIEEFRRLLFACADDTQRIVLPAICEELPGWPWDLQARTAEILRADCSTFGREISRAVSYSCILVIRNMKLFPSTRRNETERQYNALHEAFGELAMQVTRNARWTKNSSQPVFDFVDESSQSTMVEERLLSTAFLHGLAGSEVTDRGVVQRVISRLWKRTWDPSQDVQALAWGGLGSCVKRFDPEVLVARVWPGIDQAWSAAAETLAANTKASFASVQDASGPRNTLFLQQQAYLCALEVARVVSVLEDSSRQLGKLHSETRQFLKRVLSLCQRWSALDQREVSRDLYALEITCAESLAGWASISWAANERALIRVFLSFSRCNGPSLRLACAKNLAKIHSRYCESQGFGLRLIQQYFDFAQDDSDEVRREIAASLGSIAKDLQTLSAESAKALFVDTVARLLADNDLDIRAAVLQKFATCTQVIASAPNARSPRANLLSSGHTKLIQAAVAGIEDADWRMGDLFCSQIAKCSPSVFQSVDTVSAVIPTLLRLLDSGASLVRRRAISAIVMVSRACPFEEIRNSSLNEALHFMEMGNHALRGSIVNCALDALEVYSEVVFVDLFASRVLRLADDSVPNVRLRLAGAMPRLTPWCQGLPEFLPALEALKVDTDPEIRSVMKRFVVEASKFVIATRQNRNALYQRRIEELQSYRMGRQEQIFASPSVEESILSIGHSSPRIGHFGDVSPGVFRNALPELAFARKSSREQAFSGVIDYIRTFGTSASHDFSEDLQETLGSGSKSRVHPFSGRVRPELLAHTAKYKQDPSASTRPKQEYSDHAEALPGVTGETYQGATADENVSSGLESFEEAKQGSIEPVDYGSRENSWRGAVISDTSVVTDSADPTKSQPFVQDTEYPSEPMFLPCRDDVQENGISQDPNIAWAPSVSLIQTNSTRLSRPISQLLFSATTDTPAYEGMPASQEKHTHLFSNGRSEPKHQSGEDNHPLSTIQIIPQSQSGNLDEDSFSYTEDAPLHIPVESSAPTRTNRWFLPKLRINVPALQLRTVFGLEGPSSDDSAPRPQATRGTGTRARFFPHIRQIFQRRGNFQGLEQANESQRTSNSPAGAEVESEGSSTSLVQGLTSKYAGIPPWESQHLRAASSNEDCASDVLKEKCRKRSREALFGEEVSAAQNRLFEMRREVSREKKVVQKGMVQGLLSHWEQLEEG